MNDQSEKTKPKKRTTKTPDQRLKELEQAKNTLQLKINAELKKQRSKERKEDIREKIIIGSIVMATMDNDPNFAGLIETKLSKHVMRDSDRAFLKYRNLKREAETKKS